MSASARNRPLQRSATCTTTTTERLAMTLEVVSDAAGRMRVKVDWVRCDSRRAVAVEEAVAKQNGVRVVHAYPRTGSVVVWYSPRRADRAAVLAAIKGAAHVAAELIPARAPHSAEIRNTDVLRMVIGGVALALLGVRRYVFARPPLLGTTGRTVATGVTIFTGYPFLRGALRSLRSGKAGTDALVSAATVASLILRENVGRTHRPVVAQHPVSTCRIWTLRRDPAGPSRSCCAATRTPAWGAPHRILSAGSERRHRNSRSDRHRAIGDEMW
ncbi:metal cation-transporting P-type ATPase C ctpC, partial [Mycobacterium tuberculosis T92]